MGSRILTSILTVGLLLTAACSDDGDEEDEAVIDVSSGDQTRDGGSEAEAGETPGSSSDAPYVRDMAVRLEDGRMAETELAVTAIERTEGSTALYMSLQVADSAPPDGRFDQEFLDTPPALLDPLRGRVYVGLVDDPDSSDPGFYTVLEDANVPLDQELGGAGDRADLRVYYPSLPSSVETVSLIFTNMGIMTGLPVTSVDQHRPLSDTAVAAGPDAGRQPDASAQPVTMDLLGMVESRSAFTERSGDTETVAVQADLLFAFDDASLQPDATDTLGQVAATIEANGVAGTAIDVVGHTDGVGDDAYNQDLSRRRAETVRDELASQLAGDHSFEVSGRGSTEPVATEGGPDDEEARARNRRVEISYTVESESSTPDEATAETINVAERHVAEPAPYRPSADPVATETADGWQLDVYPLVRNGAYLMARLDLTNGTDETGTPELATDDLLPDRYEENLGNFRLHDPDSGLTRYVAIIDSPHAGEAYEPASSRIRELAPGQSYRGVAVYPAPSLDTDELTLQAGPFGEIRGVPIQ